MKNTLLIIITAALLVITSCKKPPNTNPGGASTGLLKTMTQIVTSGGTADTIVTTLAYDNQNRVVSQIAVTSYGGHVVGTDTVTYTFGTNSVIQYSSGLGVAVTYTLNAQGFKQSDNLGNSWVYNSAGYMTQANEVAAGNTTTYTYNSLNQLTLQTVTGNNNSTYTYTYSANPIGKAGSSWGQGESTGDFFATSVEDQNGTTTTLTATYTLNSAGLLGESSVAASSTTSPVVTYFAYY